MAINTKYLTVDDLLTRLGEHEADQILGTGNRGNRRIDRERAQTEIMAVDALIEGYVRPRYPRGFTVLPPLLSGLAYDIVRYRLRGLGGQSSDMAEVVKQRYDDALKALRDIANGMITLDTDGDGEQPDGPTVANAVSAVVPPSRMRPAFKGYLDR
ncbi:DUF1320 domain-containing protein [Candidatus Tokpelaia sp.]|uniref:DUF1320 domain-containing protein n=1 Tax=Candidatus Tokpelaia sp. TaxID=2233777 RepID=UPI001239DAF1|nr:DUF1320 domain-containing protein [Candidatus Tokpelaia sp.]KAA6404487.1 hypothetical protein DPQ22_09655 [Candidatus Tokpelaia sp.]